MTRNNPKASVECWPLLRDVYPAFWTLIVMQLSGLNLYKYTIRVMTPDYWWENSIPSFTPLQAQFKHDRSLFSNKATNLKQQTFISLSPFKCSKICWIIVNSIHYKFDTEFFVRYLRSIKINFIQLHIPNSLQGTIA